MSDTSSTKSSSWAIISRLINTYLFAYKGQLAVALFFMLIAALATASFAWLLQPILDELLIGVQDSPENVSKVWRLGAYIFLCFFVSGLATYLHVIKMNKISQSIVADIQTDVFAHFIKMDLSFFHGYPSGHLVSRITNDVNVMRGAVSDSMTGIGKSLLTLIFLVGVMLYQDWKLGLLTLAIFPVVGFFVAMIGKKLRKISKSLQGKTADLMQTLISIFQGIRQVQAYNMEGAEKARASNAVDNVKRLNIKAVRIGALSTPLNEIMVGFVMFGVIYYGAHAIAEGRQTPGGLMSFIAAFSLAYEPMKKLAKLNNVLQLGVGAAERVLALLDVSPLIKDKRGAKNLTSDTPHIELENISFEYETEEGKDKAIDDLSLSIASGKVTALVGASGSGKTTLLNLIPRFYDVGAGVITINGTDIRNIKLKSLRDNIALVSQDITIFDDSVAANIAYGTSNASIEDIEEAAKMANADDFILSMTDGYDTRLGENGVKLSGGQKQRISIARAILKDAPILLLDEATSALDNESEALIQKSLQSLKKGRTTLVVAHRLSTIQKANKIVVLEKGRIVEQGTHANLMKKKKAYYGLYTHSSLDN
jgi:subfamily B ATP-binding cassette protein MsbA